MREIMLQNKEANEITLQNEEVNENVCHSEEHGDEESLHSGERSFVSLCSPQDDIEK